MKFDVFQSKFAQDIFLQKYSKDGVETWADTSKRVVESVCSQLLDDKTKEKIFQLILTRKFIPGGRYLYASGREYHQVNNCFLFRAEDSREGWAELMNSSAGSLMSGGGIGVSYSKLREKGALIRRTGGVSTGPVSLMQMVNESGRHVMQGGQRRSAIWAGLSWKHPDVSDFMCIKNYSPELRAAKAKDLTFPLPMELTNISVEYDTEFFIAIEDESHPKHDLAVKVWLENCRQAFSTAEPGMSFNFMRDNENLRNACVTGDTEILTRNGYVRIDSVVDQPTQVWNGFEWSEVTPKVTGHDQPMITVTLDNGKQLTCTKMHTFHIIGVNGPTKVSAQTLKLGDGLISWKTPEGALAPTAKVVGLSRAPDSKIVYCFTEPKRNLGCFNGIVTGQCTEVVSEDDSDKCNLGTLWMNRFKDKKSFAEGTKLATIFLLCGGIYSHTPNEKVRDVGSRNNRIGLGLGGMHEWLMTRGEDYQVTPELHKWLSIYEQESSSAAFIGAKQLSVAVPKGVRAIAPTGTIGILAETTTGIEALFCKAYKRRYFKDGAWLYQYVVDGSVKRLLEQGVKLEAIKDSYDLGFKQRVKFQADVQNYVDMSISSTCNMAAWGSEQNNESTVEKNSATLLKYARRLRGFTVYPDGCRDGQPLERVSLEEAMKSEGQVFEEKERECLNGVCGL